ncbi:hypothetical protein GCM10010399_50560 [Dactylosporangium fulvum]
MGVPSRRPGAAPVHERDVAEVAALALCTTLLDGAHPEVAGPRTLTQRRQVELLGEALGRALRTEALPLPQARERLLRGMPPDLADALLAYEAATVMDPVRPTDTVPRLLGRPALPFGRWVRDHLDAFRGRPQSTGPGTPQR